MKLTNFIKQNNVYISSEFSSNPGFEKLYLALREKEQRVYSNAEVAKLPGIVSGHMYYKEWQIRKASCRKLTHYLAAKSKPLQILEVGCGNGWLSNQLSKIPQAEVVGLDINSTELQQAATVFAGDNLYFIYGDLRSGMFEDTRFDIIVFAASICYFPSLYEILKTALLHLTSSGEIHIVDTFFYNENEISGARQRSKDHFNSLGFPEMMNHYHHYCLSDLENFNYTLVKEQLSFLQKILNRKPIMPWICIRPSQAVN